MSLKHGLLGLLNYGEMTGYKLNKVFKDSLSFFWDAQTSQIYRELNDMEADGWLTSRIEIQTEKPNRRIYAITPAGREALWEWIGQDLPLLFFPPRSELLMQLFFSGQSDTAAITERLRRLEALYAQQTEKMTTVDDIIDSYRPDASSRLDPVCWKLTGRFGTAYYQMCLGWIRDCIQILEHITDAPADPSAADGNNGMPAVFGSGSQGEYLPSSDEHGGIPDTHRQEQEDL